jgi:thioredoxin-like negative regulator of GroEL
MPIINITPSEAYKFSSIINNKIVLCLYHWKLCGHCIDFIPRWNKITSQYKDSIIIVNIELDAMNKIPDYYKVQAFPSIILYKNGKKFKECNMRDDKSLHNFIQENALETTKTPSKTSSKTSSKTKSKTPSKTSTKK